MGHCKLLRTQVLSLHEINIHDCVYAAFKQAYTYILTDKKVIT